jgi:alpha-D-ribose 1-methylphosphonate 5-phosphate C-P lyase
MSKLGCNPWYQKKTSIQIYDNSPCNLQEYDEQCELKGLKIIAIYIDSAVLNEAKSAQSFGWEHGLITNM